MAAVGAAIVLCVAIWSIEATAIVWIVEIVARYLPDLAAVVQIVVRLIRVIFASQEQETYG